MSHNRPRDEISQHDNVVCTVAEKYLGWGYDVAVDADCNVEEENELPEHDTYPAGCGEESTRIPDVYATKFDEEDRNVEVETASTVSDERTKCQLKTFDNEGKGVVVVPEDEKSTMQNNLADWNLEDDFDIWTY